MLPTSEIERPQTEADHCQYGRKRCSEIVDEHETRERMPNGDERPMSEVQTSDLESIAFINARFSLSEEGVKAQVKLQTGEVWAGLSTLTHIRDMDLDPEQSIDLRRAGRKLSDKKIADIEKNSGRVKKLMRRHNQNNKMEKVVHDHKLEMCDYFFNGVMGPEPLKRIRHLLGL